MTEQADFVKAVTETNAKIEKALDVAASGLSEMIDLYKKGATLEMKGATGSFIVKEIAGFRRAIGLIGEAEEIVYPAHIKATVIAKNTVEAYAAPDNYATLDGGGR